MEEIEAALRRNIRVIPILVDGTRILRPADSYVTYLTLVPCPGVVSPLLSGVSSRGSA